MLVGFATAPIAAWCSREPTDITLSLLALFIIIALRRLTAGLKADLKTSNNITRVLVSRLIFGQSLIEKY
jgi:hypothetical protein